MKRAIIIGATSGIGKEVAKGLLLQGWKIGVAGRRKTALDAFRTIAPDNIEVETLDVTQEDATERLHSLIKKLGGMDLFLLSSGVGHQNMELNADIELNTARTNVDDSYEWSLPLFSISGNKGTDIWPLSVPLPVPRAWVLLRHIRLPNGFKTPISMPSNNYRTCKSQTSASRISARDLYQLNY